MQKTSSRLLALLSLLQTHRDWSGDDLAERLGITPRTVRRDIDRLRDLGYPIRAFKGPLGGYRLDAGSQLPPLLFDDDQAVALALALQSAATSSVIGDDAVRALSTVRQVMPPRLRQRIDMLQVTAVQAPETGGNASPVGTEVLVELSRAIHAREELRFDYRQFDYEYADRGREANHPCDSTAPAERPRRVHPHHLVTWRGRWYLIAWDLDRDDWRIFRADRMRPRTPTGPRFSPRRLPGGGAGGGGGRGGGDGRDGGQGSDVAAFITGRFRGTDGSTTDWPCRGEVVLSLPAQAVAPFVQDGIVEEIGPERCRLTLGSWSWTGLAATIGHFDTDIHVIGPPELTSAFAELAARYANAASAEGTAHRDAHRDADR
ncbi:DeoR family transcriptional regulator [Streptomyces longisporoflavus]|uniref:helix-turn-helix transcriptional regulator n=1 Tax=Streptomyces longisporoflavus TaxID=28044 RepID=UPI00167E63B3|nr:WYL domain-containing protein [Streptomyces longisporoflavus]GGV32404.1 DeoR family transcriptional regulator [Streptomyces longisporoflavus]